MLRFLCSELAPAAPTAVVGTHKSLCTTATKRVDGFMKDGYLVMLAILNAGENQMVSPLKEEEEGEDVRVLWPQASILWAGSKEDSSVVRRPWEGGGGGISVRAEDMRGMRSQEAKFWTGGGGEEAVVYWL